MVNTLSKKEHLILILKEYHVGEFAAIKGDHLANALGLETKHVQRLIHNLRHEGWPICGDRRGYFYASCPEDIEYTARWLMCLGWHIQRTACAMLIAADLDRNASSALAIMEDAIKTL